VKNRAKKGERFKKEILEASTYYTSSFCNSTTAATTKSKKFTLSYFFTPSSPLPCVPILPLSQPKDCKVCVVVY